MRKVYWEPRQAKSEASTNMYLVVKAKEKLLRGIKSAPPANTWVIKKWNRLLASMEKALVDWIGQTSYISLRQNLIWSKAPTLSILWRLRGVRKLREKFLKLTEVSTWGLKTEAISKASKYKVKQQVLLWRLPPVLQKFCYLAKKTNERWLH